MALAESISEKTASNVVPERKRASVRNLVSLVRQGGSGVNLGKLTPSERRKALGL